MAQGSSQQKHPLLGQQTSKLQGSSVDAKDVREARTEARAKASINSFFLIFHLLDTVDLPPERSSRLKPQAEKALR